jgi:hypothetical protein
LSIRCCKTKKKLRYVTPVQFIPLKNNYNLSLDSQSKDIISELRYEIEDYKHVLKVTRECCNEEVSDILKDKEQIVLNFNSYKEEKDIEISILNIQVEDLESKINQTQQELSLEKKNNKYIQEQFDEYKNIKENEISVLNLNIERIKKSIRNTISYIDKYDDYDIVLEKILNSLTSIVNSKLHQMNIRRN